MARILAIDFGTKRTGMAVTDPLQLIATGLGTVHTKDLLDFICEYVGKEKVEGMVIGQPKRLNNEPAAVEQHIVGFQRQVKKILPELWIERQDERFTSKLASRSLLESGLKKKQRQQKELVDEVSATIILQAFLDRRAMKFN